jgi:hypothetical protein
MPCRPSWSHAIAAERAPQTARECRQIRQRTMEPLWSPVAATGGNRSQIAPARTGGNKRKLFTDYDYHPFITDRAGSTLALEADHRRHAEVEPAICDLKGGAGLAHLPGVGRTRRTISRVGGPLVPNGR